MGLFGKLFCNVRSLLGMPDSASSVGLGDCLMGFCDWEPLEGADQYFCERCGCKRDADKRMALAALPEVLCIQLKRFSYHGWGGSKSSVPVRFPLTGLDMGPFVHRTAARAAAKLYVKAKEQQSGRRSVEDAGSSRSLGASPSGRLVSPAGSASSSSSDLQAMQGLPAPLPQHAPSVPGGARVITNPAHGRTSLSLSLGSLTVGGNGSMDGEDPLVGTVASVGTAPGPAANAAPRLSRKGAQPGSSTIASTPLSSTRRREGKSPVSSASAAPRTHELLLENPAHLSLSAHAKVVHEMNPEVRAFVLHRSALGLGSTLTGTGGEGQRGKWIGTASGGGSLAYGPGSSNVYFEAGSAADGLGMTPLLSGSDSLLAGAGAAPTQQSAGALAVNPLTDPVPISLGRRVAPSLMGETKYDLVSVVQHIGGFHGGHYIAHAKNRGDGQWYTFDDNTVSPIDTQHVLNKEAYMLFYVRQRTQPQFSHVPLPAATPSDPFPIYISKAWWFRMRMTAAPGPITNADILCDHGFLKRGLRASITSITVRATEAQYTVLANAYGAAEPALRRVELCTHCGEEAAALRARRARERHQITQIDTTSQQDGAVWYLVSEAWLAQWRAFIANEPVDPADRSPDGDVDLDGTARGVLPPGPIDNARLLNKNGHPLRNIKSLIHYRGVNFAVWELLHRIYGGGPVLPRSKIDIGVEFAVPPQQTHGKQ
jgi:hypothetical protein